MCSQKSWVAFATRRLRSSTSPEGTGTRTGRSTPPGHSCEYGRITPRENDHPPQADNDDLTHDGLDAEIPGGFERWRRESPLGAVGTGIAKGLRDVFAPSDDHQVIVAEVPGDPPGAGERLRVILHPDDPSKSVAIIPEPAPGPPAQEDRPPAGSSS
jgi:hypothetical protein